MYDQTNEHRKTCKSCGAPFEELPELPAYECSNCNYLTSEELGDFSIFRVPTAREKRTSTTSA